MTTKKIFSVPYNTDHDNFIRTIVDKYNEHIAEVYFPLPAYALPNARGSHRIMDTKDAVELATYLVKKGIRPVGLFNSTWTPVELYAEEHMRAVLDSIEPIFEAGVNKFIVNNYYVIAGKIFERTFSGVEISASINSRHDTVDKVLSHVAFTKPRHVYIDRSFNRKWYEFINLTQSLKTLNIESTVLANEGCLYNCPFKTDHDSQIGMASYMGEDFLRYTGAVMHKYTDINENICNLNTTVGCRKVYELNPWYLLKSPFIRPEDLDKYIPYVDYVKLAGRNRQTEWIENVLQAYINRSYSGSIVDLLDVADSHTLKPELYMNKKLDGILEMTANCHKVCMSCGKCKKFYDERCLGVQSEQVTCDDINAEMDESIKNAVETMSKEV